MERNTTRDLQNVGLASLGGLLEYFDFQVYVFVAAALSTELFPPGDSAWKTQVQTFGIFAIGYLVRPVASIIIAHYADRIGRKKLFVFTVLLMSVPTFLMGLLPTYAMVGWMAPAMLLILRVLQGCAVGGELPGAATFICEHAPARRLGVSSGIFLGMVNAGLLLGAAAAFIAKQVSGIDPALGSLMWRLPFIMGGLGGLLAAYLRRHLAESPLFEQIRAEKKLSKGIPLLDVLRNYPKQCAFAFFLTFAFSTTPAIYFQWLPTYLIGIRHIPANTIFIANLIGVSAFVIGMPSWGAVRDVIGWKRLLIIAAALNTFVALAFFSYLPSFEANLTTLALALVGAGALCSVVHSAIAGLICSLFPTPVRQSGYAFPYSFGTAIFSGLTPLAMASMVRDAGLAAPMIQEALTGVVLLILAATLRHLPLYLGEQPPAAGVVRD